MRRSVKNWASDGMPYKDGGMREKLLPCPWCGKIPKVQRYSMIKTGEMRYGVWCGNGNPNQCPMTSVETLPYKTREEAIAAWNKRA